MNNISGIFEVELFGRVIEAKATFETLERLEGRVFKRPIVDVLTEAIQGRAAHLDMVATVCEGLRGNGDTRYTREQIGQEMLEKGFYKFAKFHISLLTYLVSGKEKPQIEETDTVSAKSGSDEKKTSSL